MDEVASLQIMGPTLYAMGVHAVHLAPSTKYPLMQETGLESVAVVHVTAMALSTGVHSARSVEFHALGNGKEREKGGC